MTVLLPRPVCGVESSCVMIHSIVNTGRVASSREELINVFYGRVESVELRVVRMMFFGRAKSVGLSAFSRD